MLSYIRINMFKMSKNAWEKQMCTGSSLLGVFGPRMAGTTKMRTWASPDRQKGAAVTRPSNSDRRRAKKVSAAPPLSQIPQRWIAATAHKAIRESARSGNQTIFLL